MHYIVGLGNPGKEYERTRHNVGFLLLEHFVNETGLPQFHSSSKYAGMLSEGVFNGEEITLLLPHTYMNASGSAVRKLISLKEADKLMVVYDDIDLPVGKLKVSFGRGDGGHNGLKSIIESLGSKDFTRLRIGISGKSLWTGKPIRPKGEALASYVLEPFSAKEEKLLEPVKDLVKEIISIFVTQGKERVMNRYN
jgi:PTH1 family peptidyl-tRNA hydrolase